MNNIYNIKCLKCGKDFELLISESLYKRGKFRKNCSKSCASSRLWSKEHREKLSIINKNSEKVKLANSQKKVIKLSTLIKISDKISKNNENLYERRIIIDNLIWYKDTCLLCNEEIIHKNPGIKKYHPDCWKKCSGGIREGSVKNFKYGKYKEYYCDSSWELAFVIYNLEHNIPFERNKKGFEYTYNGKNHRFYPDFILEDGTYIEIKNYKSKLTESKLINFPFKIIIMYKDDLQYVFEYVIHKYGKDYTNLYED